MPQYITIEVEKLKTGEVQMIQDKIEALPEEDLSVADVKAQIAEFNRSLKADLLKIVDEKIDNLKREYEHQKEELIKKHEELIVAKDAKFDAVLRSYQVLQTEKDLRRGGIRVESMAKAKHDEVEKLKL